MTARHDPFRWSCGGRILDWSRGPLLMGILNVTPDSFSDGGLYQDPGAAVEQALRLAAEGADIIDIGGESTRPGAAPVPTEVELSRVMPVLEGLRGRCQAALSVDTTKAVVAQAALAAGAHIVNDVSACMADPDMVEVLRAAGAGVVLMHMRGTPRTMQLDPHYGDVVAEVRRHLAERAQALMEAGVDAGQIALDPGIGFGKTVAHNTRLLARLEALVDLGHPVVVGLSRKSLVGALTGRPATERLAGSLAGLVWCADRGAAVLRVHDVAASRDALQVTMALKEQVSRE
ncbi:MAG: dihydropteroate synthase [Lentisphaerae bacterium]|nr:dihydropteroate synthase [Lentisphaerota bacterium]